MAPTPPAPTVPGAMSHVRSASEETADQLARCTKLDLQLAQRRRELRLECRRQRMATRRAATHVELLAAHRGRCR
jgi:hypothetical protein